MGLTMAQHRQAASHFKEEPTDHVSLPASLFFLEILLFFTRMICLALGALASLCTGLVVPYFGPPVTGAFGFLQRLQDRYDRH